jgi:uncharacterized protein YciI
MSGWIRGWKGTVNMEWTEHSALPKNPEHLTRLVQIKALRGFVVAGRVAAVGEIVTVEAHVARDLVALERAEYV